MDTCEVSEKLNVFHDMNEPARSGGIVFFGSTAAARLPLGEVNQDFDVDLPVYNRSIEGLRTEEAEKALEVCVIELQPSRVFLMLGDADVSRADFDPDMFLEKYRWLLYTLHNRCQASLYIVSVLGTDPMIATVNRKLKKLAEETGCFYVEAGVPASSDRAVSRILSVFRTYMYQTSILFTQAMGI